MTKPRIPHTWSAAVSRIAGFVGYDVAAAAVGKSEALVYAWSNADTGKRPSLDQALALSVAYVQAGGEGEPFLDAFEFQIGTQSTGRDPCRRALTDEVAAVARETGDAIAAALALINPAASPLDAMRASAETQQAVERFEALMRRIASFLPAHSHASAGMSGELPK